MGKMIMIFLTGFMHSAVVFGQIDEAAIEIDAIPGKVGIDMKEVDDALVVRKARKGVILEDVSEDGIMIQQAMGDGMRIQKSMDDGIDIDSTSDLELLLIKPEPAEFISARQVNRVFGYHRQVIHLYLISHLMQRRMAWLLPALKTMGSL